MITREQVADLQPGDVVERAYDVDPDTVTRGPLRAYPDGSLRLAEEVIRHRDGGAWNGHLRLLTVVSRAPRPLYVNHPRTEARRGDVVRFDPDGEPEDWDNITWNFDGKQWRQLSNGTGAPILGEMPRGLRLLVDGETGQVVQ